jgi:hypothetical protein
LLQSLQERFEAGLPFRIVLGRIHEHAHAPHALALLRARGEWPRGGGCAAEKGDEIPSPHLIKFRPVRWVKVWDGTLPDFAEQDWNIHAPP